MRRRLQEKSRVMVENANWWTVLFTSTFRYLWAHVARNGKETRTLSLSYNVRESVKRGQLQKTLKQLKWLEYLKFFQDNRAEICGNSRWKIKETKVQGLWHASTRPSLDEPLVQKPGSVSGLEDVQIKLIMAGGSVCTNGRSKLGVIRCGGFNCSNCTVNQETFSIPRTKMKDSIGSGSCKLKSTIPGAFSYSGRKNSKLILGIWSGNSGRVQSSSSLGPCGAGRMSSNNLSFNLLQFVLTKPQCMSQLVVCIE